MTLPAGSELALPVQQVEELYRTLVKGVWAFQMYLPNNPIYQRSELAIREAFLPIWSSTPALTVTVVETDLVWDERVVYHQAQKHESFAWMLYKDGMRLLTLRPGVEEEEIIRFLHVVSRARLLAQDAGDDLLTLLWEQDFQHLEYQFAEIITDLTVLDPQMADLALQDDASSRVAVTEQVREDVAERPVAAVDPEDFDSTLYFLEEQEIRNLKSQVDEEYTRDGRRAALEALLDTFELQPASAVRQEILELFEMLFPNLLNRGEFRAVAWLLRELRMVSARLTVLEPAQRQHLESFQTRLSEPAILSQLLQSLEEASALPDDEDIGQVLGELRPEGLETMLVFLPRLKRPAIRQILEASVDRLGAAHLDAVLRILLRRDSEALPGAVAFCRRLRLQPTVPALEQLVTHEDAEVRQAAVEALGAIGSPGALTALERALDDAERNVRLAAVQAVATSGHKGALRRLETVVQGKYPHELERGEKRQFFEAYAAIAGPPALVALADILEPRGLFRRRETAETRTCATYAIARLGTAEARTVLERMQQDKELSVRNAAIRALREWPA
ncbi:MAG: HEAT repeat domain-containing protein [Gemmatimonadales bacterium]